MALDKTQCESPNSPCDSHQLTPLEVILVHGTWGRGFFARDYAVQDPTGFWFSSESEFCVNLQSRLRRLGFECSLSRIYWTGSNSIFARSKTSEKLLERILCNDKEKLLIGHSHGGNIIAKALSMQNKKCKAVFLATPFFEAKLIKNINFDLLLAVCIYLCFVSTFIANVWYENNLSGIVTIVLGILMLSFHVPYLSDIWKSVGSYAAGKKSPLFKISKKVAEASSYRIAPCHDLLVIRGVDDEAALWLALGAFANRITYFGLIIVSVGAIFALSVIALLVAGAFIVASIGFDKMLPENFLSSVSRSIFWFLMLYPAAFTTYCAASGIAKASFGREMLWGALWCDIKSNSSPDFAGSIRIVTLQPHDEIGFRSELTRHSIYNNPDLLDNIEQWLADSLRK